jgi:molybdopterin-binding protein
MKNFIATIKEIQSKDFLHIVKFEFYGYELSMMSLALDKKITIGQRVRLSIKPTNITIAKDFVGFISYSNIIKTKITEIERGKLLANITSTMEDIYFESIISSAILEEMGLKEDDDVMLLIKDSDLSILEVLQEV